MSYKFTMSHVRSIFMQSWMDTVFEKLRGYDEKKAARFMQIAGFLFGLIAWIAFIILNRVQGGFLGILALLVFALAFLARGRLHRETGWNMRPFNVGMAIGVGVGLVAWTAYGAITGDLFKTVA